VRRSPSLWRSNATRTSLLRVRSPTSAPESEIIVPSEAAAQSAGFSPELCETIRVIRRDVIATLRQVPAFVSAAQKMASEGRLYRVLVSEERVHLLARARMVSSNRSCATPTGSSSKTST
jgi:hypothetical protein